MYKVTVWFADWDGNTWDDTFSFDTQKEADDCYFEYSEYSNGNYYAYNVSKLY